jgi:hypothetical protein
MVARPDICRDSLHSSLPTGWVRDQAGPHSVLARLYDLNLPLVEVRCLDSDHGYEDDMNRRHLLGASTGAGAASLAAPVLGRSAGQQPAVPSSPPARSTDAFFHDPEFNYNFLVLLGYARYGLVDPGACLAIASRITDGDNASAVHALMEAGDRYAARADAASAAGQIVSARDAYLQAAAYTFTATYFLDQAGMPERFGPLWRRQQAFWDQGAALLDPPMEKVGLPYVDVDSSKQLPRQSTTLPGYFFKVDDSGQPRPLLIFTNGSDGSMPFAWVSAIAPALERGYHCPTYYGPGLGLALVDQSLHFRPDWEHVVTPVVDYALSRPEVDPTRIALMGGSQGGYWVPRAVAFEHRIAAAVADPGVWDVSTSWVGTLPSALRQLLDSGNKTSFDQAIAQGLAQAPPAAAASLAFRSRPYGFSSPFDTYTAVKAYALTQPLAGQIACPMLIADPEGAILAWPAPAALPGALWSEAARAVHPGRGGRPPPRAKGARAACPAHLRLARRDAGLNEAGQLHSHANLPVRQTEQRLRPGGQYPPILASVEELR